MTSHSPLLSHSHIRLRSLLASLALASWLGRGWSPAPHHDTPVRSERGWSHAPGGSVCRAAAGAAALLSHSHIRLRSLLASLALASWLGRGWSPAPHHDTPVRSERGWSHAPGGSVCRAAAGAAARSRSQPHLTLLASPRLARLASLASPRLPSTRLARLALLRPHLGFLLDSPCLARLASPLHSLASPPRSPDLLARLASLRSSAAAPLATLSLASLEFAGSGGGGVDEAACLHMPSKKAPWLREEDAACSQTRG